ncbi:hypothetical protein GA0115259_104857 [Streptomyces sp. MnatMP-M17]|nr:hypothetical protein GA0115259_104857 [Streptomyces sp. MnatMP-M17]
MVAFTDLADIPAGQEHTDGVGVNKIPRSPYSGTSGTRTARKVVSLRSRKPRDS